ncbi:putative identical protein binding protein [Trypoxylus dichotomus]
MNIDIPDGKVHYNEQEKLFLVQLVCESKDIIESKKTDSTTIREKNRTWKEICEVYCNQGFKRRTPKQLRKCWENIKQRRRKMTMAQKQQRSLTGDPLMTVSQDPVLEFVDREVPIIDSELGSSYNSNGIFQKAIRWEMEMLVI